MPTDLNLCLATVTTDSFVPGTLVTIHSFLKHNRWFRGDVVLLHDELSVESREYLRECHERVRFHRISTELAGCISRVVDARPDFGPKRARFFSLEAFRLREYDKVLFCDSDLLFRQCVSELFKAPQPLVACGDGAYYRGAQRNFMGEERLDNTFNAGLLMIDRSFLTDETYEGLLKLVAPSTYEALRGNLTDQVVLNVYLAGRQHLAAATYNYLLAHRTSIYAREGVGMMDARVLHFNGKYKPWVASEVLKGAQQDPAFVKACGLWFQDYVECVQRLSLSRV